MHTLKLDKTTNMTTSYNFSWQFSCFITFIRWKQFFRETIKTCSETRFPIFSALARMIKSVVRITLGNLKKYPWTPSKSTFSSHVFPQILLLCVRNNQLKSHMHSRISTSIYGIILLPLMRTLLIRKHLQLKD